ncbi:uncharacterized protein LOC131021567 isoform X2 [Salvia miltiorrhiza]|uniref:uncharacterized protein LOC131021567 isoform X2 n=1 Tax=Salvia miltiorrhiza TaxID=226208 RepID=UPI0025AD729F|nr:uncharacterized protein LOC131021567 isoform X2 [Salvia miltiorrhiza]
MKGEEKQRKFHEALLKMLYPPPSDSDKEVEEKEDEQEEANLIQLLNDPPEEEIENEEPSPSSSDDNDGGDGKLTRAQRKRLRKKKLKEADSRRRKIIGPLLPASNHPSHGGVDDASDVAEGVSGDLSQVSDALEGVRRNAAANVSEEASCWNKKKLKIKQRRKSKKMGIAKSTPSSTCNRNQGLKIILDDRVEADP